MINNLKFFNSKGESLNLWFNESTQHYVGNVVMSQEHSVELIESWSIIITEKVYNSTTNTFSYSKPISSTLTEDELTVKCNSPFFTYSVFNENDNYFIDKSSTESSQLLSNTWNTITIEDKEYLELNDADITDKSIQFNIGFSESVAGSYSDYVSIFINDVLIAKIKLFIDVVDEDVRLSQLLTQLGSNINNKDFIIFDESDVKESEIDYALINHKRKELLLEFKNIFPYLGSYKSLINIVKYFGYEDLSIKEYWKNVDIASPNFNKKKAISITDKVELFPSNTWRKTNDFSLHYNLTEESGEFDEDGLPITVESSPYSADEVLIKIFALKQKLKKYFLPFNAKIIDVVGEALYYTKIEHNYWRDLVYIDDIIVNDEIDFTVDDEQPWIIDLRPYYYIGAKIGNDLTVDGTTQNIVKEFTVSSVNEGNTVSFVYNSNKVTVEVEKSDTVIDVTNKLYSLLIIDPNFYSWYINKSNNTILFVEKEFNGEDVIYETTQGNWSSSLPVITELYFTNGLNAISNYSNAFLSYFMDSNWSVFELSNNTNEVGAVVKLSNTSFDITWDECDITWNSVDIGTYNEFELSTDNSFPSLIWNNGTDSLSGVSWEDIGKGTSYEIKWTITRENDKEWSLIFQGSIKDYNNLTCVLPYADKYTVKLEVMNLTGAISTRIKKNFIEVKSKIPNFTCWKLADVDNTTWNDLEITWDSIGSIWDMPIKPKTTWQDSIINWQSIDRVEFYQNFINQEVQINSLLDNNPYIWNNLGDDISWEDVNGLYWDSLNSTFTKFYIKDLTDGCTIEVKNELNVVQEVYMFNYSGTGNIYADFVNQISATSGTILSDFVYDYTRVRDEFNTDVDTIIAVSKTFDKPNRYYLTGTDVNCSNYTTPLNNFGAIGDTPVAFYIYELLSGSKNITINGVTKTIVSTNLSDLCNELRGLFTDWEFNLVKTSTGVGYDTYDQKIICSKKLHEPNEEVIVSYNGILGSCYGRSITTNSNWFNTEILYYGGEIKRGTKLNFNYSINNMPGYYDQEWVVTNESTGNIIKYLNPYLSILFVDRGEYSIELTLTDVNGNKSKQKKTGLIKVS